MTSHGLMIVLGTVGMALVLVALNAFFVATELAMVKVREAQLDPLAKAGSRAARRALALKQNLNGVIAATQFGITVVALIIGRFIEEPAQHAATAILKYAHLEHLHWLDDAIGLAAFAVVSFGLIIGGEMLPKAIALQRTVPLALSVAMPMTLFLRLARPAIWLIEASAAWLLVRLGLPVEGEEEGPHGEAELRLLFLRAHPGNTAPGSGQGATNLGRDIVLNSLDLRRRLVRDVMRPRRELIALSTAASIVDCVRLAEQTRYSRFPLAHEGDLDRTWGVIHFKDLLAQRDKSGTGADLRGFARPLIFVPPTARLEKVLSLFLDRRSHFALVVDEYGGTQGCITLENVLEELVGQIQDEFDHEKPRMIAKSDGFWELEGTLPLFELAELTGVPLEADEGTTTVSGWVTREKGGFPRRGDTLSIHGYELVVDELDHLRVSRLTLRRLPPVEPAVGEAE